MPLSFTWPGKKDEPEAAPASKREFPEALAAALPPAVAAKDSPGRPKSAAKGETAALEELTRCYGQLGLAMEQANQQVLAYLIERHAQAGGGALGEKLDALSGKIERLAGGAGVPRAPRRRGPAGGRRLAGRAGKTRSTRRQAEGHQRKGRRHRRAEGGLRPHPGQGPRRTQRATRRAGRRHPPGPAAVRRGPAGPGRHAPAGHRRIFSRPRRPRARSPATGRRPSSAASWPSIPAWTASGSVCSPASSRATPAAGALMGQLMVFRSVARRKNAHPAEGHRRGLLPLEPADRPGR